MALRDQPYLPLYVQDFMTDEKLAECSAEATGVYIRLMCLMHKSETYGKILLRQKHKQNESKVLNFATMLAKHLPYDLPVISRALGELLEEDVIQLDGDFLVQKRMVKDFEISEKRKFAGKKGGEKTKVKTQNFVWAKSEANSENENENEIVNDIVILKGGMGGNFKTELLSSEQILEVLCMQTRIARPQAEYLRDCFVLQAEATDEGHSNYSDYSKHFINWAKKNLHLLDAQKAKSKIGAAHSNIAEALEIINRNKQP